VSNNKDFIDQSFDEMKLLKLIKANCDPDACYLLNFKSATYYKEHLLLQTDLLKDNLFNAYRKNPSFFSIPVIKVIARQILIACSTLHALNIIHSDLKPENILIKSYSPVEIKVVDLGNSCFIHDNLGAYVQSRSYRAPEVVLGNDYDTKIDIWSVGCIIA
jgi:dual specificity tyrosine-phosphorylation-regulated kinase 2/3/4